MISATLKGVGWKVNTLKKNGKCKKEEEVEERQAALMVDVERRTEDVSLQYGSFAISTRQITNLFVHICSARRDASKRSVARSLGKRS